jgi:hypothetical protein
MYTINGDTPEPLHANELYRANIRSLSVQHAVECDSYSTNGVECEDANCFSIIKLRERMLLPFKYQLSTEFKVISITQPFI